MLSGVDQIFLQTISTLKILSVVASIVFIGGIIYAIFRLIGILDQKSESYDNHFITAPVQSNPQNERWERVVAMFQSSDPNSWRLAIIESDILLEDCFRQLGYQGDSMGEILKSMQHVPWVQSAWDVHLLRNKLAHEGGRYVLNEREAYRVFKICENILYETRYIS